MYSFREFLQEISSSTNIKFDLIGEDGNEIMISCCDGECNKMKFTSVMLGKQKCRLYISEGYENCALLLKFIIENRYRDIFSERQVVIKDILDGKEVAADRIERSFSFIEGGCSLFLVYLDGNRHEALNIIKQSYDEQNAISLVYGDNIIVIGDFEEVEEHAKSVCESITNELYSKCSISYSEKFSDAVGLKRAYESAKEILMIGKRFDIKENIFSYKRVMFEKIVFNIKGDVKIEILNKFKSKFNSFDSEMIKTIEEFINCDLNISDAARNLYIHRNTLIYRLDKIDKDTGFDVRNFREATVFVIAFLIWKECNN